MELSPTWHAKVEVFRWHWHWRRQRERTSCCCQLAPATTERTPRMKRSTGQIIFLGLVLYLFILFKWGFFFGVQLVAEKDFNMFILFVVKFVQQMGYHMTIVNCFLSGIDSQSFEQLEAVSMSCWQRGINHSLVYYTIQINRLDWKCRLSKFIKLNASNWLQLCVGNLCKLVGYGNLMIRIRVVCFVFVNRLNCWRHTSTRCPNWRTDEPSTERQCVLCFINNN